jgi:AcrR family transcriptional regulator
MQSVKDIPLQKRKQYRARLALLDSTIELIREKPLAEITVEEICEEVEVSRATFFRYFPRKVDVIFYFIRLWNIEIMWHIDKLSGTISGLGTVEFVYELAAKLFKNHPRLFSELITLRTFEQQNFLESLQNYKETVSKAECRLRFPDMEGIDLIPHRPLYTIMQDGFKEAIRNGELPADTDIRRIIISSASIFYGVPLMIANQNKMDNLETAYKQHLHILWAGVRHTDWKGKTFNK